MIDETIRRIEETIRANDILPEDRKEELLTLITNLRSEIDSLDDKDTEDAGSIMRYAESSVNEAIRSERDMELLNHTLSGLSLSVRKFEVSHPTLMGIINNIGHTLGNIGI